MKRQKIYVESLHVPGTTTSIMAKVTTGPYLGSRPYATITRRQYRAAQIKLGIARYEALRLAPVGDLPTWIRRVEVDEPDHKFNWCVIE